MSITAVAGLVAAVVPVALVGCARSDPVAVVPSDTVAGALVATTTEPAVVGSTPDASGPHTLVFDSEATCRAWTGSDRCGPVMCDFIPEGQTFESTCGPWFQEGITSSALDDAAIDEIVGRLVGTCAVVEPDRADVVHVRFPDGSAMWFGGPTTWRRATAELVGAGCGA